MVHLKKMWVRILLSLFIGGMIVEFFRIITGRANEPLGTSNGVFPVIIGFIAFLILSAIVKRSDSSL